MHADDYQRRAAETAIYPGRGEMLGLTYTTLGLSSEAGEVAGKVKKLLRDRTDPNAPLSAEGLRKDLGVRDTRERYDA